MVLKKSSSAAKISTDGKCLFLSFIWHGLFHTSTECNAWVHCVDFFRQVGTEKQFHLSNRPLSLFKLTTFIFCLAWKGVRSINLLFVASEGLIASPQLVPHSSLTEDWFIDQYNPTLCFCAAHTRILWYCTNKRLNRSQPYITTLGQIRRLSRFPKEIKVRFFKISFAWVLLFLTGMISDCLIQLAKW